MSWRTVVVSRNGKLDYQLGYLVVRMETTTKIHISEIATLILESKENSFVENLIEYLRILSQLLVKK